MLREIDTSPTTNTAWTSFLHEAEFTAETISDSIFSTWSPQLARMLTNLWRLGYIGEFEIVDDHRAGKIVVQLNGRLNKCGVISPRYNVQAKQIESWVNLLLPARGFGIIIFTTSSGIIDHEEARRKNVGGKILGYVY
jgi:small subunit ribosomal protein S15Ae